MLRAIIFPAFLGLLPGAAGAQSAPTIEVQVLPSASLSPLAHPATSNQIRDYLSRSGELEAYRLRWIAAVDKNRALGAPYWPESFWTSIKTVMQRADLLPMYITWYQHTVSEELMQRILDTYKANGAAHFQGSPACFALGEAQLPFIPEMDKLTLANTMAVIQRMYAAYQPQIKAARAAYLAAHPDYVDR